MPPGAVRRWVWTLAISGAAIAAGARAETLAVATPTVWLGSLRPSAEDRQRDRFRSTMDAMFGPGGWRQTSGYRSQAREDALRREGAGTVPAGVVSKHSLGTPDAPGAYDVVVYGLSPSRAAARLRGSFGRVLAERAHGPEGPHLHIEVGGDLAATPDRAGAAPAAQAARADACASIYERVIAGRRNPRLAGC
jgi:hypothetical protein